MIHKGVTVDHEQSLVEWSSESEIKPRGGGRGGRKRQNKTKISIPRDIYTHFASNSGPPADKQGSASNASWFSTGYPMISGVVNSFTSVLVVGMEIPGPNVGRRGGGGKAQQLIFLVYFVMAASKYN